VLLLAFQDDVRWYVCATCRCGSFDREGAEGGRSSR
jgi:hypothetical protein